MSSILAALFAVLIGMMAIRPYISYQHQGMVNTEVAATAGQERLISEAAQAYIQQNYTAVEGASTASTPAIITVPMLEATGFLSTSVASTNPYGQTWQVQVLQPTAGNLQALVLSLGGTTIPQSQAPAIAAQTGQEGGFIPYAGQYGSASSGTAMGAYGGWSVSMAGYSNPGAGHLASLVAFTNGNLQNDYLYRVAVPGQPQLNTMQTDLNMGNNNVNNANNIRANGRLGVLGYSPTSGYPTGWGGGINTWDAFANGSVGSGLSKTNAPLALLTGNAGLGGTVRTQTINNGSAAYMQSVGGVSTISEYDGAGAQAYTQSTGASSTIEAQPGDGSNYAQLFSTNGGASSVWAYNTNGVDQVYMTEQPKNDRVTANGVDGDSDNEDAFGTLFSGIRAFNGSSAGFSDAAGQANSMVDSPNGQNWVQESANNTQSDIVVATGSGAAQFWADSTGESGTAKQFDLPTIAVAAKPCSPNGAIAASSTGVTLSCVNGDWASGTGFSSTHQMSITSGTYYTNSGSTPAFIATWCNPTPNSPGYVEAVHIYVTTAAGAVLSQTNGRIQEGGTGVAATPSASAIVPAGDDFMVNGMNMSCSLAYTQ